MMDPNIIDYYLINCAIPSIITIENRYQIDFGKPAVCCTKLHLNDCIRLVLRHKISNLLRKCSCSGQMVVSRPPRLLARMAPVQLQFSHKMRLESLPLYYHNIYGLYGNLWT